MKPTHHVDTVSSLKKIIRSHCLKCKSGDREKVLRCINESCDFYNHRDDSLQPDLFTSEYRSDWYARCLIEAKKFVAPFYFSELRMKMDRPGVKNWWGQLAMKMLHMGFKRDKSILRNSPIDCCRSSEDYLWFPIGYDVKGYLHNSGVKNGVL